MSEPCWVDACPEPATDYIGVPTGVPGEREAIPLCPSHARDAKALQERSEHKELNVGTPVSKKP